MNADITSPQRRNKLASRLPEEDADGCKEYDLRHVALIHADGQDGTVERNKGEESFACNYEGLDERSDLS